jgi:S-formylglutathione hydrolase FrmB
MALITCDFFSEALEVGTTMNVVLPQRTSAQIGVEQAAPAGPPPVLYLLHGLSDDHSAWVRYTSVERYATEAGLAVVMPAVGRSFYANEAHGHRYWDFVSEELPTIVADFLAVSTRPEDTFVAGLSMGGYGALKLGLTHPDRYAAAASMSGALDLHSLLAGPDVRRVWHRVFGGQVRPHDDLHALLGPADPAARCIPLWIGCGTGDELVAPVQEPFIAAARAAGHEVTTDLRPGEHEWGLWDLMIREVIDWLPRRPDGPGAMAASED